jgi:hypothetical protein
MLPVPVLWVGRGTCVHNEHNEHRTHSPFTPSHAPSVMQLTGLKAHTWVCEGEEEWFLQNTHPGTHATRPRTHSDRGNSCKRYKIKGGKGKGGGGVVEHGSIPRDRVVGQPKPERAGWHVHQGVTTPQRPAHPLDHCRCHPHQTSRQTKRYWFPPDTRGGEGTGGGRAESTHGKVTEASARHAIKV